MEKIAVAGVLQQLLPQFAARLQRPEEVAVVIRTRHGFGNVPFRIIDNVRKRLLEEVVETDSQHEEVQPFFENPVDFLLPLFEIPMLRLEAVKAAVGEIAQAAVVESRRFGDVEIRDIDVRKRWNDVAVPEVMATGAAFEEIIDGVEQGAAAATREKQEMAAVLIGGFDDIVVRACAQGEIADRPVDDLLMDEMVRRIGTDDDKIIVGRRFRDDI